MFGLKERRRKVWAQRNESTGNTPGIHEFEIIEKEFEDLDKLATEIDEAIFAFDACWDTMLADPVSYGTSLKKLSSRISTVMTSQSESTKHLHNLVEVSKQLRQTDLDLRTWKTLRKAKDAAERTRTLFEKLHGEYKRLIAEFEFIIQRKSLVPVMTEGVDLLSLRDHTSQQ